MKKECIVVIPIYKSELNGIERKSLERCREELCGYPFTFIAPGDIKEQFYLENYPEIPIRKYENWQHDRLDDYNALMLNPEFYQGFSLYEFMFLFQTDGWFLGSKEQFQTFLQMDVDYIGAPWGDEGFRFCKRIIPGAGKIKLLYLLEQSVTCYVGNGGVSLRRISQMIALLQEKRKALLTWEKAEDLFISYHAQKSKCHFRVASKEVAEGFALEMNMREKISTGKIPMAVHKWETFYPELLDDLAKQQ